MEWLRVLVLASALILCLGSCGEEPDVFAVPDWAKVAPEQIAEAKRLGVPVAFENDIGMRFVLIPAGTFKMGASESGGYPPRNELPAHYVVLSPFYLAVTEVTNAQYRRFKADHDSREFGGRPLDGDDQPAVRVSHEEAIAFLQWLAAREGGTVYRLPSEAEWEYACRGGERNPRTAYWSGDSEEDLARVGWYAGNSGGHSHPVGQKPANMFGLHDVHGNAREWCQDVWHDSYEGAPSDGRAWLGAGRDDRRVVRGGGWMNYIEQMYSARRRWVAQGSRASDVGIRPVREVTSE